MEPPLAETVEILLILFSMIMPLIVFIACHYKRIVLLDSMRNMPDTTKGSDLFPAEIATLNNNGNFAAKFLWPEILRLAIEKKLDLEETAEKPRGRSHIITTFNARTSITEEQFWKLDLIDRKVMAILFSESREINLFTYREYLESRIAELGEIVRASLFLKGLLTSEGIALRNTFLIAGAILLSAGALVIDLGYGWRLSAAASGLIALGFWLITPKTTQAGDNNILEFKKFGSRIKNLKKSKKLVAVENYEKLLPTAVTLGLADMLSKKMTLIYGKDFFKDYRPDWLRGYGPNKEFDAEKLAADLEDNFRYVAFLPLENFPRKQLADL